MGLLPSLMPGKALGQVVAATSALTPVEGEKKSGTPALMRYESCTDRSPSGGSDISSIFSCDASSSNATGSGSSEAGDGGYSRSVSKDFPEEAPTPRTSAHRAELRKLFESVDVDGDGKICRTELAGFMANFKLDSGVSDAHIQEILVAADENGDDKLEFEEFLKLYQTLSISEEGDEDEAEADNARQGNEDEQRLRDAFGVFDANNDGFISASELLVVLQSLNGRSTKKLSDCSHMIKAVDKDGDGKVNFEEFKQMMATGFQ